jgi:hypothetical protein
VRDNRRPADDSNPMGYYKDERLKQLRDGYHEWLESAIGKVVKVVSPLLKRQVRPVEAWQVDGQLAALSPFGVVGLARSRLGRGAATSPGRSHARQAQVRDARSPRLAADDRE